MPLHAHSKASAASHLVPAVERAHQLAERFAVTAAEHDRAGTLPVENFAALHEAGLSALTLASHLGGPGAGLEEAAQVIGAIARGEPATALILVMQYKNLADLPHGLWPAALTEKIARDVVGKGALINALRVEPELGSPNRGGIPATTARRTDGGWSLSGRKIYSTGSHALSWFLVWGRTDDPEPRIGQFLVHASTPGIRIVETWDTLGMRATASHDVVFENVSIPAEHAVDIRAPSEWAGGPEALRAAWLNLLVGALYDGIARSAVDWLLDFLRNRVPSNLGAPLSTLPRVQQAVGVIEEKLSTNALLLSAATREADAGRPPDAAHTALLKVRLTENAISVVEEALKLTGNHGNVRSNPLERHYRDVLCGRIHTPQDDAAYLAAGRAALGV